MKKIMFNDNLGLTTSVLDSAKHMTRREEKPLILLPERSMGDVWDIWPRSLDDKLCYDLLDCAGIMIGKLVPHYQFDEVVAIAQSYKDLYSRDDVRVKFNPSFDMTEVLGWKNKLFVESQYMQHHIRITDIKVERLQDISEEDCLLEGVRQKNEGFYVKGIEAKSAKEPYTEGKNGWWMKLFPTAREAFAALIDKISGKGTWDNNPWVVAYSFELVD